MRNRKPPVPRLELLLSLILLASGLAVSPAAQAGGRFGHGFRSHQGFHAPAHHAFRSHRSFSGFSRGFFGHGGFHAGHRSFRHARPVRHLPIHRPLTHYPVAYATHYGPGYPSAPAVRSVPQPIIILIQQPAVSAMAGYSGPQASSSPVVPSPAPGPPPPNANASAHPPGGPGQLWLSVEPSDATVYLDQDALGSGADASTWKEPLELRSGVHVLEVIHPDLATERLVFGVPAADQILVEIHLAGDRRGRRARVRTPAEVESRLKLLGR